jgi:hypothetical protein
MSKRSDRRAAEREAHKLAYQQLRQPSPVAVQIPQSSAPAAAPESDLLARAQAFFDRPTSEPPTTSAAQIAANQANAKLSTGPTTPEGKAISSRNHSSHGLAASSDTDHFRVLATEKQSDFDAAQADFRTEWKPNTATEHDLVNRMVLHQWLRNRALRLQETLFDAQTGEVSDIKKFDLYRRYETSHERGFNKALADIQRLRAFQLRLQNGFESQKRKNEEHDLKIQRLKRQEQEKIQKIQALANRSQRVARAAKTEQTSA